MLDAGFLLIFVVLPQQSHASDDGALRRIEWMKVAREARRASEGERAGGRGTGKAMCAGDAPLPSSSSLPQFFLNNIVRIAALRCSTVFVIFYFDRIIESLILDNADMAQHPEQEQ